MTAIKGRPGDFHRFVNAEICHKSLCFLHILLFNVSSKDLCGLFQKEKKSEIFDTGQILIVFQGSQTRD